MAWEPTNNVITARAIATNALDWLTDATRQAEALTWADNTVSLKPILTYANSTAQRAVPVYPAIRFSDDNDLQDIGNDLIEAAYTFTLEVAVQSKVADTAVTNARVYAKAIVSMIANCPPSTLGANTGSTLVLVQTIETGFDPIKAGNGGLAQNDFLQEFQIRIGCSINGPLHL